jgi:hypothetical protein
MENDDTIDVMVERELLELVSWLDLTGLLTSPILRRGRRNDMSGFLSALRPGVSCPRRLLVMLIVQLCNIEPSE